MPQSDFSQQEKPVFCLPRDGVSWTFTIPREPLPVWWTKCGTRNDSSAGSRPDRQARGDFGRRSQELQNGRRCEHAVPGAGGAQSGNKDVAWRVWTVWTLETAGNLCYANGYAIDVGSNWTPFVRSASCPEAEGATELSPGF